MRLEADFKGLENNIDEFLDMKQIQQAMTEIGIEAESHAKNTINTFTNHKGNQQGVDSGAFRDGVRSEPLQDEIGFVMRDGVEYGIFHEYGTAAHFQPFFDKGGTITGLGKWALRRFDELGFGKNTGKREDKITVLRKKGGFMVQLDEMAPFRKSLAYALREAPNIFKRVRERG